MYGNGVLTGITIAITRQVRPLIPPAPQQALAVCYVVVVGTPMRRAAECRFATTAIPAAAAASSVFGLPIV